MHHHRATASLALTVLLLAPAALLAAEEVAAGLRAYAEGDYRRAADGLQQAAAKGHPEAQRILGVMQLLGQGTERDPVSAARWLQSSARLGNRGAQELMSYLLTQGLGVDKDYVQAYAWLKLVALRTDDPARASALQTAIARLTSTMSKEELGRARALSRDYYSKFLHPYL